MTQPIIGPDNFTGVSIDDVLGKQQGGGGAEWNVHSTLLWGQNI